MQTMITTAARRIARAHNERIKNGFAGNGKLLFDREGNGGEWYSAKCYGFDPKYLEIYMRWGRITHRQAQTAIDLILAAK